MDNRSFQYCVCIGIHTRALRTRSGDFCDNCDKPLFPLGPVEFRTQTVRGESSEELIHLYENIFDDRLKINNSSRLS